MPSIGVVDFEVSNDIGLENAGITAAGRLISVSSAKVQKTSTGR